MMIAQGVDLVTLQKLTGYSTKELTDYSSRYYVNALDAITSSASSSMEAGLLAMAYTGVATRPENKKETLTNRIKTAEGKKPEAEMVGSMGENEMER